MSIRKGFLVMLLMVTLLFLLLPSEAMAGGDAMSWLAFAFIAGILILVLGIYKVMEWDRYYDVGVGDIFMDIQSNQLAPHTFGFMQDLQPDLNGRIDYNFDYLLTERSDGVPWVAGGLTLGGPVHSFESNFDNLDYGWNLLFGFREDQTDCKWRVLYFQEGGFRTNAEINFRF